MAIAKNNSNKPNKKNSNIIQNLFDGITLSDTLILAAVPFVAYLVVYFYEYGYFSVFQIPLEMASFDLSRIFIAILSVISWVILLYFLNDMLREITSNQPEPIRRRLNTLLLALVLSVAYLFLIAHDWRIWLAGILFLLLIASPAFWIPLFTQKSKKGYIAKLIADDIVADQRSEKKPDVFEKLAALIGPQSVLFVLILAGSLYLAFLTGQSSALQQKDFVIVNTSPERVILWTFNDHMVSSTFDRGTKQIDPGFVILNIGQDPKLEYHFEKIGPLTKKKPITASIVEVTPTITPLASPTP